MDTNNNDAVPLKSRKKRGRPRKTHIDNYNPDKLKNQATEEPDDDDDDIILHLPINLSEIKNMRNRQNITSNSYNDECGDDDEVIGTDAEVQVNQRPYSQYVESENENDNETEINIFTVNDKDDMTDIKTTKTPKTRLNKFVHRMDTNFICINAKTGKQMIQENKNIACWWCSHHFDGMPYFLPEKCVDGNYYVFGCFCDVGCAASYNLNMNDYNVWTRYSLLKRMYNVDSITLAPQKELFEKFGGCINHESYINSKANKNYLFLMPPMTSIVPLIEEIGHATFAKPKADDGLVLKRSKPLANSNFCANFNQQIKIK